MDVQLCAVGGYDGVGKNMTALCFDNKDAIILDMGLRLDEYVEYKGSTRGRELDRGKLKEIDAIPADKVIGGWKDKMRAIVIGHAHLDHVGASPYLAHGYDCPIIATPFTIEVLKASCKDEGITLSNTFIKLAAGETHTIREGFTISFIHITHSTPQTVLVLIRYDEKTFIYANDFKIDRTPVLEAAPNFDHLSELGDQGIDLMICDCLYAAHDMHTPSEKKVEQLLFELPKKLDCTNRGIFVTTFSSHVARVHTIVELAKRLGRRPVFIGKSLIKYLQAAERAGVCNLMEGAICLSSAAVIRKEIKRISAGKKDYLIICTGHQGEPNSFMWRLVNKEIRFNLQPNDIVVFSSNVIPTPYNQKHRGELEQKLEAQRLRIMRDIHVSGHLAGRDHKDLLLLLRPRLLVPTHGEQHMTDALITIAKSVGVKTMQCRDQNIYQLDV